MWSSLKDFLKGNPNRTPKQGQIEALKVDPSALRTSSKQPRLMWFGHSAFLLQTEGLNLLFDPMLSDVPAPHPWLGTSRYSGSLPIEIAQLPSIDAVIISHDHYDHLDYESIRKLSAKTAHFFVPLGVARHLIAWGVNSAQITELDWWQSANIANTTLTFTPSRHFSGRGLSDKNTSLWGSWHLKYAQHSLYFSGDTGYGPHFKEINQRLGAVDFALLECGQYNKNWADIHMMPEQTVQAAVDLQAKLMMPVHWGAFTLSLHDWYDPAIRVSKAAQEMAMPLVIPQIGEIMQLQQEPSPRVPWWLPSASLESELALQK
jgi:L-ascorbate metabolism protein UlaG (beta-lactamase superfamily)